MSVILLKNPELFHIPDGRGAKTSGGSQYWYSDRGYAASRGCGPATASNILTYMLRSQPELFDKAKKAGLGGLDDKAEYIEFMKKIYVLFKPGLIGLPASGFMRGAARFAKAYGLPVSAACLRVPEKPFQRPSFEKSADFIRSALSSETPVAFLALSTGGVANLYKWHWVTIIGLDEENKSVLILDNTKSSWAEIGAWHDKSLLGGALVRFAKYGFEKTVGQKDHTFS